MEQALATFFETFSFTGQSALIVVAVFFFVEGVLKPSVKALPYDFLHSPIIVLLALVSGAVAQVGLFDFTVENVLMGVVLGGMACGIHDRLKK